MSVRPVAVVLGARGPLGAALVPGLPARRLAASRRRRRTPSATSPTPARCAACSRASRPDVVFNAAAYTDVDRAESEPDRADAVNAAARRERRPRGRGRRGGGRPLLDRLRVRRRAARPYDERDPPSPQGRYARVEGGRRPRWSPRRRRGTSSCASAACTGTAGATSRRRSCAGCAPARPSAPTAIASARRPGCARWPRCRRRSPRRRTTASTTAPPRARRPGRTSPAWRPSLVGVPAERVQGGRYAELPLKAPRPRAPSSTTARCARRPRHAVVVAGRAARVRRGRGEAVTGGEAVTESEGRR